MFQWQTALFSIGLIRSQISFFKTFLKLKYQKIRQHLDRNIFDVVWKITLDTDKQIQAWFWKKSALADRETHSLRLLQDKKMGVPGLPDNSYGWQKAHCFNDYMERVIGTFLLSIRILVSIFFGQESMGRSWRRWGSTTRARRTTWTASSSAQTLSGMVGSSEHQENQF